MVMRCAAVFLMATAVVAEPTLYHNASIYTVDAENAVATAMLIDNGRIVAIGDESELRDLASASGQAVDLEGRFVYPGFIDAHGHLPGLAQGLMSLDFVGTDSYEQIIAMVAERAATQPAGTWIQGRGWDQNDWPEKAFPHHAALSAAVPDHPVVLTRIDGHAALANLKALEIAGIIADTPDPTGGKILRDDKGAATGVLIDRAQGLVSRHIPPPDAHAMRAAVIKAQRLCLENGLISVHDAGVSNEVVEVYEELIASGDFQLRVYVMLSAGDRDGLQQWLARGPMTNAENPRLTVRSIKAMADGALGSRGAAMLAPYSDDPENTGLLITDYAALKELTQTALHQGFQVCTHAIGDRANRIVLDAYNAAMTAVPAATDPRLRIEHAQIVSLEDIPRFAKLGVIPSMQSTHATSDMPWAEERVGPERIRGAYAWRKFLDAGCRIANGSDFPVENVNPLWGFYASITRQDHGDNPAGGWRPEERMTREEALRSFTIDAAYAAFQENMLGSLEPGKLADFVVLSEDIMTVPSEKILETRVLRTIIAGKTVYQP